MVKGDDPETKRTEVKSGVGITGRCSTEEKNDKKGQREEKKIGRKALETELRPDKKRCDTNFAFKGDESEKGSL